MQDINLRRMVMVCIAYHCRIGLSFQFSYKETNQSCHRQHLMTGCVNLLSNIYWSKVLTNQPGRCQFFRKYEIVKNLRRATIKQDIIHLSKLLKFIFRKSHYVTFCSKQ